MADIFLRNARDALGFFFFLDCAFRVLINWAGKLRSNGCDANVCTHLYNVQTDVLVEGVQDEFGESLITESTVHEQQLIQVTELRTEVGQWVGMV